ncbi:MAG: methyltransferase domain-containing protein [Lachnospiraceae bacterium]|nr:methyltransferase domain-containing protein [Lachnospiraceae bacterium]
MEAYTEFANVYDVMMDDIPYGEWADYVEELLADVGVKREGMQIAEIGCGTGNFLIEMAKRGYRISGVDLSPEMLAVAKKKLEDLGDTQTKLLEQDMCKLRLMDRVDAIVSICDSINYVLEPDALAEVFRHVDKNLKSNGVFIMDMKTKHFFEDVLAYNTMAANYENCSYIWDNYYHEEERVNEYLLTLYIKEGVYYRRCVESHYQKAYEIKEIQNIARANGFTRIDVYDAFTFDEPSKYSERVYFVFQR